MRLALWLFAALSFAEFAPASKFARYNSDIAQPICVAASRDGSCRPHDVQVVLADRERLVEVSVALLESALDDDSDNGIRIPRQAGKPIAAGNSATTPNLDGQSFAAFDSRAPPAVV